MLHAKKSAARKNLKFRSSYQEPFQRVALRVDGNSFELSIFSSNFNIVGGIYAYFIAYIGSRTRV